MTCAFLLHENIKELTNFKA